MLHIFSVYVCTFICGYMWPHVIYMLFWSIKMERLYMQSINQWTCIHQSDVNFPETTSVSLCRSTMVRLYLLLCLPMCVATAFLFQSPLRRTPFTFALGQTPVAATVVSVLASLRVGFSLSIQNFNINKIQFFQVLCQMLCQSNDTKPSQDWRSAHTHQSWAMHLWE